MAIAFVGFEKAPAGSGTTIVINSRTYTTGNAIALWLPWEDVAANISSISGGGNTFFWGPPTQSSPNGVRGQWAYAVNITGFTGTITATFDTSLPFSRGFALEYSGIATASAFEAESTSSIGFTATPNWELTANGVVTSTANCLILAGIGLYGSHPASYGASWTSRGEASESAKVAEKIVSSAGTYGISGTGADSIALSDAAGEAYSVSIIALKAAAAAGGDLSALIGEPICGSGVLN